MNGKDYVVKKINADIDYWDSKDSKIYIIICFYNLQDQFIN